jgi:hypothetical protein
VQACGSRGVYGLLVSPRWPEAKLGLFQTKRFWKGQANVGVIGHAAGLLREWAEAHPQAAVHMNCPGIGFGGLGLDVVLPLLQGMPPNVTVWMR